MTEFSPWDPHDGRRERTQAKRPLASHALCSMYPLCHTPQISKCKIKKITIKCTKIIFSIRL